jgi:hypothetical protein
MERSWKNEGATGRNGWTFFVFKPGARLNKPNLLSLAATSCGLDRMVRRGRRFESVRGLQESAARAGPSLVSSLQLLQHARGWNRFWNSQTENGFDFVVSSGNEAIFEDSGVEHRSAVDHLSKGNRAQRRSAPHPRTSLVASTDCKGWSLHGAPWLQRLATRRRSESPQSQREQAKTLAARCDKLPIGAQRPKVSQWRLHCDAPRVPWVR